jgi:hypothetical protein
VAAWAPLIVTVLLTATLLVAPAVLAGEGRSGSPMAPGGFPSAGPVGSVHAAPQPSNPFSGHDASPAPSAASPIGNRLASPLGEKPRVSPPTSVGVEYSGVSSIASQVQVSIAVPDDLPPTSDLYSVVLSVFDGAQSYDQLGFANDHGTWGVYYSIAAACGTRLNAHLNVFPLTRGTTYTFQMSTVGGGLILFELLDVHGRSLWQQTAFTAGTYFEIWSTQNCGSRIVPDFTETEEVYNASLGIPPYDFFFTNSSENGQPETAWAGNASAAVPANITRNGSNITIYNEPFVLAFAPPVDRTSLEATPTRQFVRTNVSVESLNTTTGPVAFGSYTLPLKWVFNATPSSGIGSFVSQLTFTVPGGVVPGTYVVGIDATNGTSPPNRIALEVEVLPSLYLTITAAPVSGHVDANETVLILLNGTGGASPYTFTWTGLPTGCASALATATCRFVAPGSFSVHAGLTDSLRYVRSQNATFVVHSDPSVAAPTSTVTGTVGRSLSLEISVAGGLAPFSIRWAGLPAGCPTANSTNLTCTPASAGNYTTSVTVTDSVGFRASVLIVVVVVTQGSGGLLSGTGVLPAVVAGSVFAVLAGSLAVLWLRRRPR